MLLTEIFGWLDNRRREKRRKDAISMVRAKAKAKEEQKQADIRAAQQQTKLDREIDAGNAKRAAYTGGRQRPPLRAK